MEGQECDIPDWWAELSTVLEEDTGRLAREVRASFQLPRHMHELDPREAAFHAPLAPPCLHQQRFMPPVVSIFASLDIQEIPREKMVAYAWALQYLAEQNNPPTRDQPCLLAESIAELRREVGFYLSFMDEEVFHGIDLPEEEGSNPSVPTTTTADAPGATDTPKVPPIPKAAPKYAGWDTVVHLSWPVVAAGETPQPITMPRMKRRALQLTQTTSISPPANPPKAPLPPKSPPPARALALVRLPTPPHGFTGVAACLKTPKLVEVDQEMPLGTMSIGMVSSSSLSSISSSQVVKDDTMGLVYLDTMMTSIGRIVLGSLEPSEGPIIEDITNQLWKPSTNLPLGRMGCHSSSHHGTSIKPAIGQTKPSPPLCQGIGSQISAIWWTPINMNIHSWTFLIPAIRRIKVFVCTFHL